MARRRSSPPADLVELRLLQNAYVHGQFKKAGTVMQFPKAEANLRLSRTRLWVRA